jgi:hypothetical protein
VIPRPLVCVASALLTTCASRALGPGAHGPRPSAHAGGRSVTAAQANLRPRLWAALIASLNAKRHGERVIQELERLRLA